MKITCPSDPCGKQFDKKTSFSSHLSRYRRNYSIANLSPAFVLHKEVEQIIDDTSECNGTAQSPYVHVCVFADAEGSDFGKDVTNRATNSLGMCLKLLMVHIDINCRVDYKVQSIQGGTKMMKIKTSLGELHQCVLLHYSRRIM